MLDAYALCNALYVMRSDALRCTMQCTMHMHDAMHDAMHYAMHDAVHYVMHVQVGGQPLRTARPANGTSTRPRALPEPRRLPLLVAPPPCRVGLDLAGNALCNALCNAQLSFWWRHRRAAWA